MKTLAIETSCDDTSLAIIDYTDGDFGVEKILLHSQIDKHRKFGGVVPELASRLHEEKIMDLLEEIGLDEIKKVDFISYTCCPGLPGSLLVGTTLANTLSTFLNKEKVPVHHIHGHISSIFIERNIKDFQFPLLVLTVSGGHNDIYLVLRSEGDKEVRKDGLMLKLEDYLKKLEENYGLTKENLVQEMGTFRLYKLGFTLDDAAGEAFDKVSKMLGGPYPGGKWVYELSAQVNSEKGKVNSLEKVKIDSETSSEGHSLQNKFQEFSENSQNPDFNFPRIWLKKSEFLFSFSGLKAQVNYKIKELKDIHGEDLSEEIISKVAYEFQEAAIETLGKKLLKAAKYFDIKNVALVGGVSANLRLKSYINENKEKFGVENFYTPLKPLYSTDNAAMIGVAGIISKL